MQFVFMLGQLAIAIAVSFACIYYDVENGYLIGIAAYGAASGATVGITNLLDRRRRRTSPDTFAHHGERHRDVASFLPVDFSQPGEGPSGSGVSDKTGDLIDITPEPPALGNVHRLSRPR